MQNRLYGFEPKDLSLQFVLNLDFWYTENIYTDDGRLFLFNSLSDEPTRGMMLDVGKKTATPFQF